MDESDSSWLGPNKKSNDQFLRIWRDLSFWYIGICDKNRNEIYRRDLPPQELAPLAGQQSEIELVCELQSGSIPAGWTVWPVSRSLGWLQKIEGQLREEDFTILLDEDE